MDAQIIEKINYALISMGFFLCMTLAPFFLFHKSEKSKANIFLGCLILVLLTYFFSAFFFSIGLLKYVAHSIQLRVVSSFLLGPLIYLYVRAATQKGFEMRPILWLHFLPAILEFLRNSPFYFSSSTEKLAFYQTLVETGQTQVPMWVNLIKTIIGLAYFFVAFRLTLRYKKHLGNEVSLIDKVFHRWLIIFCLTFLYPVIAVIGFTLFNLAYFEFIPIYFTLLFGGLLFFLGMVYLNTLFKPELFHTFPHQMLLPNSSEEQKQKYESSKLQENQKAQYITKLRAYMELEKPYQVPDLTLAQLSEPIKIPAHHLSQVINEKLDCSFLDFVNGYRIESAKAKLVDPKLRHYKIMVIAYEAGFNSKSTFYVTFKKHTGMTPSQYRKQKQVSV